MHQGDGVPLLRMEDRQTLHMKQGHDWHIRGFRNLETSGKRREELRTKNRHVQKSKKRGGDLERQKPRTFEKVRKGRRGSMTPLIKGKKKISGEKGRHS